ncbi:class I SAM-dependent methyltransferase [Sorangium sp. So ce1078]|uniref:class I SAM-dependent methyltransferase n=1 Tax=Sorangium sp. So ce1078 TaxID=3133329 RepID=UPI003F63AB19
MHSADQLVRSVYDRIAERYDDRWGRHMRQPQDRLTAGLELAPGARCADIGCGTGSETVEMLRQVAPGEVVGVDCSEEMLRAARARAAAAGLQLSTRRAEAELFLRRAEASSFDVVTLRFCLAYLDWRSALPCLGPMLRPGGRAGVLTNLASSTPQAYSVYCRMADELNLGRVELPVPDSAEQVSEALQRGGLRTVEAWTHRFRLWFGSGALVASWLQESGFVTHVALREFPPEVLQPLCDEFATRLEVYREPDGIPLDFELAGIIAVRR